MSSTVETQVVRRKDHKGGKVVSLTVIWSGVALVVILGIIQTVNVLTNKSAPSFDRDVVAVTPVQLGNKLQPVSAKIMASDSNSIISPEAGIKVSDYAAVWQKLERLSPATASDVERQRAIEAFLSGLDYKMKERGGEIVSMTTGDPINPSTVACYLNGYIPDKPYLKTNCPSF